MPALNFDFKFYPGQCGLLDEYFEVEKFYFPREFKDRKIPKYDYAILKLTRSVKTDNFLPLGTNITELQTAKLMIYGYPVQPNNYTPIDEKGSNWKAYQFGLTKEKLVKEVKKERSEIIHLISTRPGQSGTPIILVDRKGNFRIVGIHKGGFTKEISKPPIANIGRIVDQGLIAILQREAAKLNAQPFS